MTAPTIPNKIPTVDMNYRGRRPFQVCQIHDMVLSEDLQDEAMVISKSLDSVNLLCGHRVPTTQVLLCCDPDVFDTHLVICQSSTDGRTISSMETGDIRDVIADAAILTSSGHIYNAHVVALYPKPTPVQKEESEIPYLGAEFERLESSVTNSDPNRPLKDDSISVRMSEDLLSMNSLCETVTDLVDGATLAILQYCPIEGSVDPPVTIEAARKAFFDGIRRSVC